MQEVADGLFAIGAVFVDVDDVLVPELVHFVCWRCAAFRQYRFQIEEAAVAAFC